MKSKAAKSAIDIVVTLLIFGIGQLAGGIISGVIIGLNGGSHSSYSSSYLVLALLPANVVTIVLLLFSRYLLTTMTMVVGSTHADCFFRWCGCIRLSG